MKLSKHAFTRFWDVHAWVGVLGGLVLHVMFFAGGFALFREELTTWQERAPTADRRPPGHAAPLAPLVAQALRDRGAAPTELAAFLPHGQRRFLELSWPAPNELDWVEVRLDPTAPSAKAVPAASLLADTLYYLHFLYHPAAPWGMYVAGFFAVALLLALVTGVLIHIKDLARQFHQFRPLHSARVLWSDMHKVLGVMGLPFQTMFGLTGAVLGLEALLLLALTRPVFHGDASAATAALWGGGREVKASGRLAPGLDIDQLVAASKRALPGFTPTFARFHHLGDANATVRLSGEATSTRFGRAELVLRATDGAVLSETVKSPLPAGQLLIRWITGLHYGLFGGLVTKLLYALLSAATCLTILTGNWIWLLRRQTRLANAGPRLLAKLTIGLGGGILPATAALFWANRVLPAELRRSFEPWALFWVWGLVTFLFLVRADSRSGWVGLLRLSGAAFVLLPLGSALGTDVHLFNAVAFGRPDVLGVECGLVLFGIALLLTARVVHARSSIERAKEGQPELVIDAGAEQGA